MAELGLCSRREADDWIARGWVRVDGQVAPMGLQVGPQARIEVDHRHPVGRPIAPGAGCTPDGGERDQLTVTSDLFFLQSATEAAAADHALTTV